MEFESEPEYLTVDEAAALLRVDRKTIYASIDRREIEVIRLGRVIRIPRHMVASKARKSR